MRFSCIASWYCSVTTAARDLAVGDEGYRSAASFYCAAVADIVLYVYLGIRAWLRHGRAKHVPEQLPLPTAAAASLWDDALLSVIIPAFNEGEAIVAAISTALELDDHVEVIVADGGSTDGTMKRAKEAGARVLDAPSGRAACLNAGAAAATGDLLLFLHGDTILPPGYGVATRRVSCPPRPPSTRENASPPAYPPTTPCRRRSPTLPSLSARCLSRSNRGCPCSVSSSTAPTVALATGVRPTAIRASRSAERRSRLWAASRASSCWKIST